MSEGHLRIRRGDSEVELKGDPAFVREHLAPLMAIAFGSEITPAPAATSDPALPPVITVKKNLRLEDFVALKAPRTERDRLLILAYYQERYEKRDSYAIRDLENLWSEHWPEVPWDEGVWQEAVEEGFLLHDEPGRLTLSYTGENYVREGLA